MQFQNVDVVACFRARGKGECLVRRRVEVVQAPTELRILDDGKEAEGGIGRPIDRRHLAGLGPHAGGSEGRFARPFIEPGRRLDVEVGTAQTLDVCFAGPHHFTGDVVENVEVARIAR